MKAQEYLDKHYPKEERQWVETLKIWSKNLEGCLDLSDFVNLKHLDVQSNYLTDLDLSKCSELEKCDVHNNQIISVDFLTKLPNPKKLKSLQVWSNNIQPTDIAFFKHFSNIEELRLGGRKEKRNHFYGSFESWKDLSKLKFICIEATDVNEGLEYLPFSLALSIIGESNKYGTEGAYSRIECSPRDTDAKCSIIQEQLRYYNYDLKAWQLAHPELMKISRPEYFINFDSEDIGLYNEWIWALKYKIESSQIELSTTKLNEPAKIKKIERLESKVQNLAQTKNHLEKSTQTDLTGERIQQLLELEKQIEQIQSIKK